MKNSRNILMVIIICLIAAMGWWIKDYMQIPTEETMHKSSKQPDYSMDTFTLTATDEQGKPHYQLTASTMTHFQNDEDAYLTRPFIIFYRENESPWEVQSAEGSISSDGKVVNLKGKVNIARQGSSRNQSININTSKLTLHTDSGLAETDATAYIKSDFTQLEGKGMQAYLNANRLHLLSNVRGTHVYNQHRKQVH